MTLRSKIITLSLALSFSLLAGCAFRQAKAAPAPPPAPAPAPKPIQTAAASEPISLPQTDVYLPRPQAVDPAAVTAPPPDQPAEPPPPVRPTVQPTPATPKVEPPVQVQPPPVRPPVRVVESAGERRRIQTQVESRKKETEDLVARAKRRRLSADQQGIVQRIQAFLEQASAALQQGDMQQADALSNRALLLSRDLNRE
jgi:outer membrane biosynthesis protein TonB